MYIILCVVHVAIIEGNSLLKKRLLSDRQGKNHFVLKLRTSKKICIYGL